VSTPTRMTPPSSGARCDPLRVLITVDPEIPVPPVLYGGIERIVDMLVRGLRAKGHEVHLFANGASETPASHFRPYAGQDSRSSLDTIINAWDIWRYARHTGGLDVIHSFSRQAYLLPSFPLKAAKIQSYQRHISPRSVRLGSTLGRNTLWFTACSQYLVGAVQNLGGRWSVIHNGAPVGAYAFAPSVPADAPLIFLGRLERIKGPHTAIRVARQAGRRLIIAGNRPTGGPDAEYFEREVAPFCDNDQVTYIGPVNDARKNRHLGEAAALLFPIEWNEPFGIVMVEALACGTPVIALARGAVREVVEDGHTGFACQSTAEMVQAVEQIHDIDRRSCRASFEQRFSDRVIVDQYETLYRTCVGATRENPRSRQ
jgi:glycosyltransferase involved in cell wall biosynthesis